MFLINNIILFLPTLILRIQLHSTEAEIV